ncbi:MAG TPA: M56 family metallopeptidase [Clostridiales bacterium]|nr:M56 family metallopeptidase [Clostridiales bacterium]
MKDFMIMLATNSAALSAVILLYAAVTPLLSKRYSSKWLYYSWLIIVAGLIVPFRPQLDVPGINVTVPAEAVLTRPLMAAPEKAADTVASVSSAVQLNYPVESGNPVAQSAVISIQWWQAAAAIWATGVIVFLLIRCIRHYRLMKMLGRWSEDVKDDEVLALMDDVKNELGIPGQVSLYLCRYTGSPMMTGILKPRILLPATDIPKEELRFILKHELVHCRRKDTWYKCLLLIATAMHWFNPAVYLMAKVINEQCELSCDAEVLRDSDPDTRDRYCKAIVGLLETRLKTRTALSTNFYGGKNGMKKRISSILDTRKKKAGLSVACAMLILTAGIGIASAAISADNAAKDPPGNVNADVVVRLADHNKIPENYDTYACYVDARPQLEFYIDGKDIAQIEVTCRNEYVYAVDLTQTQHEKYWNVEYYQTYDEETGTCTFYPERRYDKAIKLSFDKEFSGYGEIWYRWTAWNLYKWASEDNFSHFVGFGIDPKIELPEDMTEEQKLKLAAGENGSGPANIGHICLDGYPEGLARDRIEIKVTDREGNSVTKYINVEISNNEFMQTVVTAYVED